MLLLDASSSLQLQLVLRAVLDEFLVQGASEAALSAGDCSGAGRRKHVDDSVHIQAHTRSSSSDLSCHQTDKTSCQSLSYKTGKTWNNRSLYLCSVQRHRSGGQTDQWSHIRPIGQRKPANPQTQQPHLKTSDPRKSVHRVRQHNFLALRTKAINQSEQMSSPGSCVENQPS